MKIINDVKNFVRKSRKWIFYSLILYVVCTCFAIWLKMPANVKMKKIEVTTQPLVHNVEFRDELSEFRDKIIEDGASLKNEFYTDDDIKHSHGTTIPKIIHQQWFDHNVPCRFHDNIRSFLILNPDYEYYIWTIESARRLIQERHVDLLETFDNYKDSIRRANMIKYVVLYEYGGIYADLDIKCLRNLDRIINNYSCVLVPEPYVVTTLIYNTELTITNSLMLCKAQHSLLERVLAQLSSFAIFATIENASGTPYFTFLFNQYNTNKTTHNDSIQIASHRLFRREMDLSLLRRLRQRCRNLQKFTVRQRKGCIAFLQGQDSQRNESQFLFMNQTLKFAKDICSFDIRSVLKRRMLHIS
ncbi:hypothetical protein ACF0H5_012130 [Mactra antiquata]